MDRAFELDPDLAEAQLARAYYLLLGEWKWDAVDEAFAAWEQVLHLVDSPEFSGPLGYGYSRIGQTEKAREVLA